MENRLFAYVSDNIFLAMEGMNQLKEELKIEEEAVISLDMEESSLSELLEELTTIPFLSDYKFIQIKHATFLNEQYKGHHELEQILAYLKNPNPTNYVVFLIDFHLEGKENLANLLKKYVRIIKIGEETVDLPKYVLESFRKDGYRIDDIAVNELIERTDGNISLMSNEIAKLKMFKLDQKKITFEDINILVSRALEDKVYELTNNYLKGNMSNVLEIYNDLLLSKEDQITIINNLFNKFQELFTCKILLRQGKKKEEIASYFNIKPGRAYYLTTDANLVGMDRLKEKILRISDLDFQIKSGKIDKKIGLELFLLGE